VATITSDPDHQGLGVDAPSTDAVHDGFTVLIAGD